HYELIIVDECSMISSEIVSMIMNLNNKILFSGDPAQLPPVNEQVSDIFNKKINSFTMEQVVRNKHHNVVALSNDVRELLNSPNYSIKIFKFNIPNSGVYFYKK